jgi:hypothetical protein
MCLCLSSLSQSLLSSQQNFTVSDPSLPDNPIVYCSPGFLKLTGYSMDEVSQSGTQIVVVFQHLSRKWGTSKKEIF